MERIYLSAPYISEKHIELVSRAMRGGWIAPVGPELNEFEKQLAERFNLGNVLAVNSGTSALHLAVKLAGITRSDRVLIGSFTFIAAANAVLYEGGIPVFMDSDAESWNVDPDLLRSYLSQLKEKSQIPKAIIVTHIFGRPARIQEISEICSEFGVLLIEDAAEALNTFYGNQHVGTFGDYGIVSFNGNKLITTSGGGALLCKNEDDREKALYWSTQSKLPGDSYHHQEIGYNYRLSNICAAIGLGQLDDLAFIVSKKQELQAFYLQQLSDLKWFEMVKHPHGSNHWLSVGLIRKEHIDQINPSILISKANEWNIELRRFWKPMHLQPIFQDSEYIGGTIAEDLYDRGICLPSGAGLTSEQLNRVVQFFRNIEI